MSLFQRKPGKAFEQDLVRQANQAVNWFGTIYKNKASPQSGTAADEALDLTNPFNRNAVRLALDRVIENHDLGNLTDADMVEALRSPLLDRQCSYIDRLAMTAAVVIASLNFVLRTFHEQYPHYKPFQDLVDMLTRICGPGAAQLLGRDLSRDVTEAWPYFALLFKQAKGTHTLAWPDV